MDDLNKTSGELKGFDSVNGADAADDNRGYTVTPDGGFYTKQKSDIIQDEILSESKPNPSEANTDGYNNSNSSNNNGGQQYKPYSENYYVRNPYNVKPKKVRNGRRYGGGIVLLASVLAAVIGAVGGIGAMLYFKTDNTVSIIPSETETKNVNISIDETAESVVEAVATKVTPSVVGIRTTTAVMSFFGGNSEETGEGSGIVYTQDGYILTNYHVVSEAIANESASKIEVFIDSEGSDSYEASVVGYNISSDLAVLKINVTGLTPIEIADSSQLKVGQYVITVGNPGGLEFMDSVTFGVISGLDRVVSSNSTVSLIQTDAAINPGNSGGALVNTKGQLVGINSSKIVSEEFEGMGFALPSNQAVEICKKIISKQNNPEPYIGITVSEKYTSEVLKYYGYPVGAVVLSVADGSPAEQAGIAKGDIITEFNGTTVKEYSMLNDLISDCTPGNKINVKIYRSGRYYTTNITVGSNNAVE